jgi:two-component system cell cycle response regulator CpdR
MLPEYGNEHFLFGTVSEDSYWGRFEFGFDPVSLSQFVDFCRVRTAVVSALAKQEHVMIGKLLLLVEDEVLIAHSLEEALTEAGFEVQLAVNGTEATKALEANATSIAALITDIRLPLEGPNGFDLAHRARELSPKVAVIYVSGDSAAEWASKGVPKSVMLAKPFAIAQLITAVSQLLNDSATQLG